MTVYRVFNEGEIANLAHGWRSVIALAPGRKWITIVDWTTLDTTRVPLDLWQRLRPRQVTGYSLRRVRAAIKTRLRYVEKPRQSSPLPHHFAGKPAARGTFAPGISARGKGRQRDG